ncbi:MAG: ubiquinol-cytochrome c reductase iron-sulfur subunit [Pseudomonadota bacterium]
MSESSDPKDASPEDATKRDFMVLTACSMTAVGAACTAWPLIDSLNPSADVLAMSSVEIDISHVAQGQSSTFKWRGKPVFVFNRTAEQVAAARAVPMSDLRDPQMDQDRVKKDRDNILVTIGICTHLGCVPITDMGGEYGGYFCPCHGSHYDTSGRIRKGPAPYNLAVPPYEFLSETKIRIG